MSTDDPRETWLEHLEPIAHAVADAAAMTRDDVTLMPPQPDDTGSPLSELSESGLLWLINRTVFHPRGFALALHADSTRGAVTGWSLKGDGSESWMFPEALDQEAFQRAEATLRAARASQSPERHARPGGDTGDGHEPPNPTAALSAPTMRPEDVPEALIDLAMTGAASGWRDDAALYLANAIPAIREQIADEIEQLYGPLDPPIDDQDEAVLNVVRHLRGLCTICGRAPDAEPCGHAHAMTQRGEGR